MHQPLPTKSFGGNAAWLILNTIAHNFTRWATRLGLEIGPVMTKKIRRRIYNVTGRLVATGRRLVLRLSRIWPWADAIIAALRRLRALPTASCRLTPPKPTRQREDQEEPDRTGRAPLPNNLRPALTRSRSPTAMSHSPNRQFEAEPRSACGARCHQARSSPVTWCTTRMPRSQA